jgi:pentatricopeptide repeat protein
MALHRPSFLKLLAPLVAFAATLALLHVANRSSHPAQPDLTDAPGGFVAGGETTGERVERLQAALRANPKEADGHVLLGDAYLQNVRERGDASFYAAAEGAYKRALALTPHNAGALAGMGSLALARHDFHAALRLGREAQAAAPGVTRIYGVIVDALVELGRYDEAEQTLQRMVDLKPNLSSYARVSYFRELHGNLRGAVQAMRLAVSAGGDAPENVAYVQTLLGHLLFERGDLRGALRSYRLALFRYPRYVPASAGVARVEAARGDVRAAIARYRRVVTRLPLPEYVIALGETELAAGKRAAARRDLALVRVEERLLQRNGVNTDVDLALYEANHGDPRRAVELAKAAYAAAPSVRSADALGWALTRAGRAGEGLVRAREALRLGSQDPSFLYHAGVSAQLAGRRPEARSSLSRALARNPRFSPLYAPRARRALRAVSR